MSKFDLQKIKRGIFCCMAEGYWCKECPYKQFDNENENCQSVLEKDINEIFLCFEILNNNG